MNVLIIFIIVLLLLVFLSLIAIFIFLKRNGFHAGNILITKDENETNVWRFSFNKGWDYEKIAKYKFVTFKIIKENDDGKNS